MVLIYLLCSVQGDYYEDVCRPPRRSTPSSSAAEGGQGPVGRRDQQGPPGQGAALPGAMALLARHWCGDPAAGASC